MRPKRVDSNQAELVRQLRKIPGVTVAHTHTLGEGFPDLLVSYRGFNYLLEVKDPKQPPSRRRLTPDEQLWHQRWTGQVSVVETFEEVLKLINR